MLKKRKAPAEVAEPGSVTFDDAIAAGGSDTSDSTDADLATEKLPSDSEVSESSKKDSDSNTNDSENSDDSNSSDDSDKVEINPKNSDSTADTREESNGEPPFDDAEMRQAFEAWLDAREVTSDQRESICAAFEILVAAIARGQADESLFELIALGADYDRAVAEAEKAGEITGRNASIDELMAAGPDDDGVPHPGVSSGPVRQQTPTIFDIARTVY